MSTSNPMGRTQTSTPASPLEVKDRMTAAVHSIGKDQTLAVAHRLMAENGLRHLPVLERGKVVGLLSERDLYYLETVAGVDPALELVEEGMRQDVYCTSPESKLLDVVTEMANRKYGCAVVVEGGKLTGIFTVTDAMHLLSECLRAGR